MSKVLKIRLLWLFGIAAAIFLFAYWYVCSLAIDDTFDNNPSINSENSELSIAIRDQRQPLEEGVYSIDEAAISKGGFSLLVSVAACDSSSMSDSDVAKYENWEKMTDEGRILEKIKSTSSPSDELLSMKKIEDHGARLFQLSLMLEACNTTSILNKHSSGQVGQAKKCRKALGEIEIPKRRGFEVLMDAAHIGNFPALLKLAGYEPE